MTKRLVDIDDAALETARRALGTTTMKDTVNAALRLVGRDHSADLADALDRLTELAPQDRGTAWR